MSNYDDNIYSEADDYSSCEEDEANCLTEKCLESKSSIGDFVKKPPKKLDIVVKRVGNGESDSLTLKMDPRASVLDLKTLISDELAAQNDEVPVDRQRLMYFGRMLRDNEELLGETGIKMRAETTNYVHLSPLPAGAKPSKRSSSSTISGTQDPSSNLQSRLERARRLGSAARERRRRRRAQPYDSTSTRRRGDAERAQSDASVNRRQEGFVSLSAAADPIALSLQAPQLFNFPLGGHGSQPLVTSILSASQASPLSQISQLTASVAAATREAQSAHIVQQVNQGASNLLPSLGRLDPQLRRFAVARNSDLIPDHEIFDTINMLERVSQESTILAASLRSMAESSALAQASQASNLAIAPLIAQSLASPVMLNQLLGSGNDAATRAALLSDGLQVALPGPFFTSMM